MIAIVDYGMGNLRSVQKAFQFIGADAAVTSDSGTIKNAKAIVLPGVGAFKDAVKNLNEKGLTGRIVDDIREGKPYFGICLGMQILFSESEEGGPVDGLGVLPGNVTKIAEGVKIPHMGWNTVNIRTENELFDEVKSDSDRFYFVHSYRAVPDDKEIICTTTDYGDEFVSSISTGNIFACQFHPEKSGSTGLKILSNFVSRL